MKEDREMKGDRKRIELIETKQFKWRTVTREWKPSRNHGKKNELKNENNGRMERNKRRKERKENKKESKPTIFFYTDCFQNRYIIW